MWLASGHPTSEVRLWSILLDAKLYPARELMETYAKRWEEELFFKEFKLDAHPRGGTLLQSHTPETAAQELAAIFIAMALLAEPAHGSGGRRRSSRSAD